MTTNWKETSDLNEIAQAFKDGRKVQYRHADLEWMDLSGRYDFTYIARQKQVRIAVPPVSRPWSKPEDVPGPVCWIRGKGEEPSSLIQYIEDTSVVAVDPRGRKFSNQPTNIRWHDFNEMEHSTDRKQWHPCTVTDPA